MTTPKQPLNPAEQLLGDLTDFVRYTEATLDQLVASVQSDLTKLYVLMIGTIGLVAVTQTEANRLQFIKGATLRSATGSDLERVLVAERSRRNKDRDSFRDLLKRLHGVEPEQAAVEDAWMKYEAHRRQTLQGTAPVTSSTPRAGQVVPPRTALRTEPGPTSARPTSTSTH